MTIDAPIASGERTIDSLNKSRGVAPGTAAQARFITLLEEEAVRRQDSQESQ
jgi:hypothetical protein